MNCTRKGKIMKKLTDRQTIEKQYPINSEGIRKPLPLVKQDFLLQTEQKSFKTFEKQWLKDMYKRAALKEVSRAITYGTDDTYDKIVAIINKAEKNIHYKTKAKEIIIKDIKAQVLDKMFIGEGE